MQMLWPRDRYEELSRIARHLTDTLELPPGQPANADGTPSDSNDSEYITWDEPRVPLEVYGLVQGMASMSNKDWKALSGQEDFEHLLNADQSWDATGEWADIVSRAREHLATEYHDDILEAQESYGRPGDLSKPRSQRYATKRQQWIEDQDKRQLERMARTEDKREANLTEENAPEEGVQGVSHEQDQPNPQVVGPQPVLEDDRQRSEFMRQGPDEDHPNESASERGERYDRERREKAATEERKAAQEASPGAEETAGKGSSKAPAAKATDKGAKADAPKEEKASKAEEPKGKK